MITTIRREPAAAILAIAAAAGLALLVGYPLASVLQEAVLAEGGFDVTPVTRVLANPVTRQIVANTVVMGILAGVGATLLGFAMALTAARVTRGRARTALHYTAMLPLIAPPFALALSTIFLFGRQGLISKQLLGLEVSPYGLGGLLFVQVITFSPVAYLIFDSLVRQLDPALEEAALNLGASRTRILRTVIVPLLRPGFAGAFLIIFVESLADDGDIAPLWRRRHAGRQWRHVTRDQFKTAADQQLRRPCRKRDRAAALRTAATSRRSHAVRWVHCGSALHRLSVSSE